MAELFQRSRRIEKWGRGIKMILERESATEFEEVGTVLFVARFWRKKTGPSVTEKTADISEKTSEKILGIIRTDKTISARKLSETLEITRRAVEHQIARLKEKGYLKRIGPDKGGQWEISEN